MPTLAIKRTLERVPGGLMIVPLFAGALVHTLVPGAGAFFGSFTGALFSGALAILAVFYVCLGATIALETAPVILKKGGTLLLAKVGTAALVGTALARVWGEAPVETGALAGLSTLAVVAAMNDTNGGLYMALMGQLGRPRDVAAYALMSVESGPCLTMVTLGLAGLAAFPWPALVGALLPLAAGMLLGNLDAELRDFLGRAVPVLIPFFAFAIGAGIDLTNVWRAGLVGLALGVLVVLVTGSVLLLADRASGGDGTAGLAAASTAGNAVAVPAIVAAANPAYRPAAASATVLVAASVVVTAVLVPLVTTWWHARVRAQEAQR